MKLQSKLLEQLIVKTISEELRLYLTPKPQFYTKSDYNKPNTSLIKIIGNKITSIRETSEFLNINCKIDNEYIFVLNFS